MDGPTPSAQRSLSAANARSLPWSGDRAEASALLHLRRPDGRLQVGLGPRAWLVQGWSPPAHPSVADEGLASGLVRALAGSGSTAGGARLPPYRVTGHGTLATRVRAHLSAAGGTESDDGVVVLVSAYAVPVGTARQADLAATLVLPVIAQTHRVVVGPWAGLAAGPCLHCLDLHRTDGDPAWPILAAALDDPTTCPSPPRHAEDVVGLVTALTGLLVGGLGCDGRDEPGLAYEVGARRPHLVLRRWPAHPACPWHHD